MSAIEKELCDALIAFASRRRGLATARALASKDLLAAVRRYHKAFADRDTEALFSLWREALAAAEAALPK